MTQPMSVSAGGGWLVALAAIAGCVVSIANYFDAQSGIAGEPGTVLVIASAAILALFGWFMTGHGGGRFFRAFVAVSALLDIAGTAFAGYLLHSQSLFYLMLLAFLGWLIHVFGPRPVPA
jgi:hypothetical protein